MQLVINISEEMYRWVNDVNKNFDDYGMSDFINLVKKGIPLPKGHGRLFDEQDIVNSNYEIIGNRIYELEPIIEADKDK